MNLEKENNLHFDTEYYYGASYCIFHKYISQLI